MATAHESKLARGARARARRQVVGVLGSGDREDPVAEELGRWIASRGWDLLTGGGGGVMSSASRGFFETPGRRGVVIGVLPGRVLSLDRLERRESAGPGPVLELRDAYPNPWVETAIYTHLPDSGAEGTRSSSRNHINVLSADVLVAFPGGEGTFSEMWLAVRYGVPIVACGAHGRIPPEVEIAAGLDRVRQFVEAVLG